LLLADFLEGRVLKELECQERSRRRWSGGETEIGEDLAVSSAKMHDVFLAFQKSDSQQSSRSFLRDMASADHTCLREPDGDVI
jgi:hypothetical protein